MSDLPSRSAARTPDPAAPERTAPAPAELDAFYTRLWRESGADLHPPERRRWRWMTEALRRHAGLPRPWRTLDYGCGGGRFLPLLAPFGTVDGFDVTPTVLEEVARRHPEARIVAGDGTFPSPLESGVYHLAVATEVIEHTYEQGAMLEDLHRVLRPGGLLLLTTPNGRFETVYKARVRALQPIESWLDESALRRLAAAAGFELLELATLGVHEANLPYRDTAPYRLAKRLGRRLGVWERVDNLESRLATALGRGITLVAILRKPSRPP